MQKFNLELLKGKNVAVLCGTKEKAEVFIKWVNSLKAGNKVVPDFHIYKDQTCYRITEFGDCGFNRADAYEAGGVEVIHFGEAKVK